MTEVTLMIGREAVSEIFPAPRVFWWLPVTGQRHANRACDRTAPTGAPLHTLCNKTFDRPVPPTDADWLWPTCEQCWAEACKIVASQPRSDPTGSNGD